MKVGKLAAVFIAGMSALCTSAQTKDISISAGVNVPIYKGVESDAVVNISYGQFFRNGLGFRTGLQWSPSVADVENAFGIPVAFAYKTHSRNAQTRLQSGASGAINAAESEFIYGGDGSDMAKGFAGGFLMNLFSNMEFFAGITPGYIAGQSGQTHKASWGDSLQYWEETSTQKRHDFYITLDAGMCLNYSIWRFDIKLMPAFHYNLADSLIRHRANGEESVGVTASDATALRWFFSFCGGLSFNF